MGKYAVNGQLDHIRGVRQKGILTVYCFTCAGVFNVQPVWRRKAITKAAFRSNLHTGCNYSVKEHWLKSDRQWLRDMITRELAAKITSRKKVRGEKKVFRPGCISVNPQLVMLGNCWACWFIFRRTSAALCVPQTLVHPPAPLLLEPGTRPWWGAQPSTVRTVQAAISLCPSLELLKCGVTGLLTLLPETLQTQGSALAGRDQVLVIFSAAPVLPSRRVCSKLGSFLAEMLHHAWVWRCK